MQTETEQFDVGVIVARFQVHELTDAHRDLIQTVSERHEKVIIFLGLSPLPTTANNPLDFEARKQMILAEFPNANVLYVMDQFDDGVWSRKLDEQIGHLTAPGQSVVLYGSRDSFIPHYVGCYPTQTLADTQYAFLSGTAVRKAIGRASTKASPDFRAGVIWASQARFPTSFQCVDVAPLNEDGTKVLLGRKPNEKLFRFIGGFVDPRDETLEHAAHRETLEEAGVELAETRYVGSRRVDDWRYRSERDKILTTLFCGKILCGRPTPGDDIEEVRWFQLPSVDLLEDYVLTPEEAKKGIVTTQTINPGHRTLLQMLVRHLKGA